MCGIVGVLVFNNSNYIIERLYTDNIRDAIIHRGSCEYGTWISNNKKIVLAHRRLSIIDLSNNANQSLSNEDNSIFVTFKGVYRL